MTLFAVLSVKHLGDSYNDATFPHTHVLGDQEKHVGTPQPVIWVVLTWRARSTYALNSSRPTLAAIADVEKLLDV